MQSSQTVDQEKLDQRRKTDMEDPAAMTIEFLRARLLSERSVSRVARQRADELAKRVEELEEQLKLVTVQRKKAEKATAEVLAILENNEINDLSEALDFSTDHGRLLFETEENDSSTKKEENSASSRPRTNEVEGLSGSEVESSPLSGRSLSWKSCNDGPNLHKKKIDTNKGKRWCTFLSTGSSSTKPPRMGKSCRQIKRRETISEMDNAREESSTPNVQEYGVDAVSGDDSGLLGEESPTPNVQAYTEDFVPGTLEDQREETNSGLDIDEDRRDANLERALENQAQLMDQYEAEETAQREWEKKFKENKIHTTDSSEHGNQSDITEERDEARKITGPDDMMPLHAEGPKLEGGHHGETAARTLPTGVLPTTGTDLGCLKDQQCNSCLVNKAGTSPENLGPTLKGKQKQDLSGTLRFTYSEPQSTEEVFPLHKVKLLCNGESSGSQNRLEMALYHETPKRPGDVLQALQQAKSSLKHELYTLPVSRQTWPVIRMSETPTPFPAIRSGGDMDIPYGCVGLFRVPTDLQMEATTRANFSGSDSHFGVSLTKCQSSVKVPGTDFPMETTTGVNVFGARSECSDSGPCFSKLHHQDNQYPSSSYLDLGLRNSSLKSYFDPCLGMGMALSSSAKFTSPSSYADVMPGIPSNGGLPKHLTSIRPQIPGGDHYSAFDGEIRSKML